MFTLPNYSNLPDAVWNTIPNKLGNDGFLGYKRVNAQCEGGYKTYPGMFNVPLGDYYYNDDARAKYDKHSSVIPGFGDASYGQCNAGSAFYTWVSKDYQNEYAYYNNPPGYSKVQNVQFACDTGAEWVGGWQNQLKICPMYDVQNSAFRIEGPNVIFPNGKNYATSMDGNVLDIQCNKQNVQVLKEPVSAFNYIDQNEVSTVNTLGDICSENYDVLCRNYRDNPSCVAWCNRQDEYKAQAGIRTEYCDNYLESFCTAGSNIFTKPICTQGDTGFCDRFPDRCRDLREQYCDANMDSEYCSVGTNGFCGNRYVGSDGITRITCSSMLDEMCKGSNVLNRNCQDYFVKYVKDNNLNTEIVRNIGEFCTVEEHRKLTMCGCFYPKNVVDKYYDDLNKTLGPQAAALMGRDVACSFPPCQQAGQWQVDHVQCPDESFCINAFNVDVSGNITGDIITGDQTNNCEFIKNQQIANCAATCENGNCVEGSCECSPGWSGVNCDAECQDGTCPDNKICKGSDCVCKGDYSGENCDVPCNDDICIANGGTGCGVVRGQYSCMCPEDKWGDKCQYPIERIAKRSSIFLAGSVVCLIAVGVSAKKSNVLSMVVLACLAALFLLLWIFIKKDTNSFKPKLECSRDVYGFNYICNRNTGEWVCKDSKHINPDTCKCYPGFGGAHCDRVLISNECSDNGYLDADFICVCQAGFRGDRCQDIDKCAQDVCPEGTVCENDTEIEQGYKCV